MARKDLERVARAAARSVEARDELRDAILNARESGETFEDIAKAAGVSRQRIAQIVRGSKPDS